MDFKDVEHAKDVFTRNFAAAAELAEQAEKNNNGIMSGEDMQKAKRLIDEATEARTFIDSAKDSASLKSSIAALGKTAQGDKVTASGLIVPDDGGTLGEAFVKSDVYGGLVKSLPANPGARAKMQIQSNTFSAKDLTTGLGGRGILDPDLDLTAGVFVQSDRRGLVDRLVRQPLTMRDVVSKTTTTSDTVEFVREATNENNAEFVPEAVTAGSASVPADGSYHLATNTGGYKPQGSFSFETDSTMVKTVAEWMPVTTRALSDAGQIRALIDQKLRADIDEVEDGQLFNGDGVGENLRGLMNVSGKLAYGTVAGEIASVLTENDGMKNVEMIKRAKTRVRITGRARANAVLMHPEDIEETYLARVAKNPAIDGSNAENAPIAGLVPIENERLTPGTAVVGDFSRAWIYDREGISLQVTNSHADFFIRNLVAILAEKRLAFAVHRPSAFCVVTLAGTAAP